MEIKSGNYAVPERNIRFDLPASFDLGRDKGCYFIRGANGIGKTSFLEKILIPALDRHNLGYLYIGQDIRIQLYTLRALLAVSGHRVMGADALDILKLWITHSTSARIFILDEFDKYFSEYGFIFEWSHTFIQHYIFVTHHDHDRKPAGIADGYRTGNLRFDMVQDNGPLKQVRIIEDPAWQS